MARTKQTKRKQKDKVPAAAAAAAAAVKKKTGPLPKAKAGKGKKVNQTVEKVTQNLSMKNKKANTSASTLPGKKKTPKTEARAVSRVQGLKAFKESNKSGKKNKKAKERERVAEAKREPKQEKEENLHMSIIGGDGSSTASTSDGGPDTSVALRRLQASLAHMTGPVTGTDNDTVDVTDMGSLFVVDTVPQTASDSRSSVRRKQKKQRKKQKQKAAVAVAAGVTETVVDDYKEGEQEQEQEDDDDEDDDDEQPLKKMRTDPPVFDFSPFAMETDVFEEADKVNSVGAAIRDVLQRKAAAATALALAAASSAEVDTSNDGSKTPANTKTKTDTSTSKTGKDTRPANTTTKKRARDEPKSAPAPGSAPARVQLSKGPLDQITMVSRASTSNNNKSTRGSTSKAIGDSGPRRLDSAFDDEQARLRPPPWITPDDPIWGKCRGVPELKLHNEIVKFTELVSPTKKEQTDREEMVKLISSVVNRVWPKARTEVFGSFSTDLCLPASDVDMVVFGCTPVKKAIYKLARELRDDPRVNIYRMQVIDKARVPIIKLELKDHKYQADICFDQDSGPETGKLIRSLIRTMPEVRALTLLVKYFLAQRGLNETYMGGMGSYLCFLTVVSTVQHFRRRHRKAIVAYQEKQKSNRKAGKSSSGAKDAAFERDWGSGLDLQHNLGRLLLEYFALYGKRLNFTTTAISLRDGGTYRPKTEDDLKEARNQDEVHRLCIENPRDAKMDVGRSSHKIAVVRRAFRYAHDVLSIYVGVDGPRSQGLLAAGRPRPESILEQIIFVDETLATRDS